MKKTLKLASLTFLMFGCAVASEFRPPMAADRGPQRLDMNVERTSESNWELDMYSVAYSRNANKSFTKHGGKTAPLSALIFGKDAFKIADALPQGLTTAYSEETNINLNATVLNPRVTYSETGVNLGGKLGYRVWDGKGTVALKVNVPFTSVRMERDNNAETAEQGGQQDYILGDLRSNAVIPVDRAVAAPGNNQTDVALRSLPANMYRVSFVQNLPFLRGGQIASYVAPVVNGAGNFDFNVSGAAYNVEPGVGAVPAVVDFGGVKDTGAATPFVFVYHPKADKMQMTPSRAIKLQPDLRAQDNAGNVLRIGITGNGVGQGATPAAAGAPADNWALQSTIVATGGPNDTIPLNAAAAPNNPGTFVIAVPAGSAIALNNGAHALVPAAAAANVPAGRFPIRPLQPLPQDPAQLQRNTLYTIPGNLNLAAKDAYARLLSEKGDDLWLMTVAANDGSLFNAGVDGDLRSRITRYGSESAEQWLWRNGYIMQNNQRTGLGDITINPCYEHIFSKAWQGSVYAHVLIPTGGSRKTGDNSYKARLGNDNHVELGGGANVAWQALDWMNVRLDTMAAYALPAKERIAATFKGATVKGVGPAIDVDIDYTRLRASLDTTMVHPKAAALATTIGYDFEFRTRDNVSLKNKTYTFKPLAEDKNSWFGGFWNDAAGAFQAKTVELDPAVQAKDTERISHNLRVESSWHATEQLSIFWGGSAPLFGQNVAKMNTIYGGMNVKF